MLKRGDIVQRVVIWSRNGDGFTVYGIVLDAKEDGTVYVLTNYNDVTTAIWKKHGYVPTGRTFELTALEAALRGC